MKLQIAITLMAACLLLIFAGCSSQSNPSIPDNSLVSDGTSAQAQVLFAGTMTLNPDKMTVDVSGDRNGDVNYNITGLLGGACPGGCFKFRILSIVGTVLTIELKIENPTSIQVYDVRLIYNNLYGKTVLNPDSYTSLFVKSGIAPFTAFAKEYANRAFPVGPGGIDTEELLLDFPPGAQAYVDFMIVASLPSNTGDPYEISEMNVTGELTTTGGSAEISAMVYDHQDDINYVAADTTVLTGGITFMTEDIENPGKYMATITNSENAPEGSYLILIAADSSNVHNAKTYNYLQIEVVQGTEEPGKIVFVRMVGSNPDIFSINDDGTGETQLTSESGHDWEAKWSPDGSQIVWRHGGYETANIWVMNEDGSGKTQITTNGWNFDPAWTPDGAWIYFWSYNGSGGAGSQIWKVKPDGSNQQQVSSFTELFWIAPSISPGSTHIALEVGSQYDPRDIWIAGIDCSNPIQLTNTAYWEASPVFTLDSSQIVFTSNPDSKFALYIMNLDGSGKTKFSFPPSGQQDFSGVFTDDPNVMAVWRRMNASSSTSDEIGMLNIDTGEFTQLTDNEYMDQAPHWHQG